MLNNNDGLYNKLLEHKIHQKVRNEELLQQLEQRKYEPNSIVEDFECFVCQRSVDVMAMIATISEPRKAEDMCGVEPIFPKMQTKIETLKANAIMRQGKCEADLIRDMIVNNQPFTQRQMHNELIARYNNGVCKI